MPKVKMTTLWLAKIKPGEPTEYSDTEALGLRLRVWPTRLTWCFAYKIPGGKSFRRVTIGEHPPMGLAEARKAVRELRVKVDRGEDPAGKIKELKKTPSFAELCEEYLEKHAVHKRSRAEDERIINRELVPRWGTTRADKITRRQVIALLDEIVARGSPIMANRTLALVRKIFNWAVERDIIEHTPCNRIKPPAPERSRDRWLTDEEIRAVWEAVEAEPQSRDIFKLLLLTAQRKMEVQSMRWDEIDMEARAWTIPPERAKNGVRHLVPLSEPVLEILSKIRPVSQWVFPSPRPACGHIKNLKEAHGRIKTLSGVDFHIHDLRRTAATGMARLGVDRVVITKILNQADRSVTAVYERHGYEPQMRRALEKWAAHVMRLVRGETAKIVTLPTVESRE